jgi:hypothetical protein
MENLCDNLDCSCHSVKIGRITVVGTDNTILRGVIHILGFGTNTPNNRSFSIYLHEKKLTAEVCIEDKNHPFGHRVIERDISELCPL